MKRFLATALVALVAVSTLCGVAYAGQTYGYNWIPISFCTQCGNLPTTYPTYGTSGWQTDSSWIYVPNVADTQDTSLVISLPDDFVRATDIDSIPEFVLLFHKSAAGASGDSLYALVQPSVDGVTFTEPTWLPTYYVIGGTSLGGAYPYRLATSFATSTNWTNVAPRNGIRAVRVRLYWDGTAASTGGGKLTGMLGYLSNKK